MYWVPGSLSWNEARQLHSLLEGCAVSSAAACCEWAHANCSLYPTVCKGLCQFPERVFVACSIKTLVHVYKHHPHKNTEMMGLNLQEHHKYFPTGFFSKAESNKTDIEKWYLYSQDAEIHPPRQGFSHVAHRTFAYRGCNASEEQSLHSEVW